MSKEYTDILEERLGQIKTSELQLKSEVIDLKNELDRVNNSKRTLQKDNDRLIDNNERLQQTVINQQEQITNLQKQIAIYEKMDFNKVREVKQEVKPNKDYEKRETYKTKQTFKLVNKLIWIVGLILFVCFGSADAIGNLLTIVVVVGVIVLILFVVVGLPILFILWKTGKLVFKKRD